MSLTRNSFHGQSFWLLYMFMCLIIFSANLETFFNRCVALKYCIYIDYQKYYSLSRNTNKLIINNILNINWNKCSCVQVIEINMINYWIWFFCVMYLCCHIILYETYVTWRFVNVTDFKWAKGQGFQCMRKTG